MVGILLPLPLERTEVRACADKSPHPALPAGEGEEVGLLTERFCRHCLGRQQFREHRDIVYFFQPQRQLDGFVDLRAAQRFCRVARHAAEGVDEFI